MAEEIKNEQKIDTKVDETGENMDSENLKAELMAKFKDVQDRNRTLNSKMIIGGNDAENQRVAAIQQLFGELDKMGVDLNNKDSINKFLLSLEQRDPDLRELFEYAMDNLLGE